MFDDLGFVTTFDRDDYDLEYYIGETPIYLNRLVNPVRVSLGLKPMKAHYWMYYYGDRDNIPDRLKETFGYK